MSPFAGLALALVACSCATGCARGALVEARVALAADSEASLDTLHDYEIGETASRARVADLEALLRESRGDPRVLVLLARAWCRLGFAFTADSEEQATELGDPALSAYHRDRARAGYERAAYFADAWLEQRANGYRAAQSDGRRLATFVASRFEADAAEALLWAGFARVMDAKASRQRERAEISLERGRLLLQRSLALEPELRAGFGHLALAFADASGTSSNLERVAAELDLADRASNGTRLFVRVARARLLACARHDRQSFERELDRVLQSGDLAPELRLENVAAKRRARLYLTSQRLTAECFPDALEP